MPGVAGIGLESWRPSSSDRPSLAAVRRAGHGSVRHRRHPRPDRSSARAARGGRARTPAAGKARARLPRRPDRPRARQPWNHRPRGRRRARASAANDAIGLMGNHETMMRIALDPRTPWDAALAALTNWMRNGGGARRAAVPAVEIAAGRPGRASRP